MADDIPVDDNQPETTLPPTDSPGPKHINETIDKVIADLMRRAKSGEHGDAA